LLRPNLHLVLTHYPVVNKNGDTITSAVTNLDLHDIARVGKTYGIGSFFVVTPLTDQKALVEKIVDHWTKGAGGVYNPKRRQALELIRICDTLADVADSLEKSYGVAPKFVATTARKQKATISFETFKPFLNDGSPYVLILGTAWGLTENVLKNADYVLAPIAGPGSYNHLPVRAAAAIMLDRLMGDIKS